MTWLEKKQGQLRMGWAKTAIAGEINYLPLTLLASYISMPTLLVFFKSPFSQIFARKFFKVHLQSSSSFQPANWSILGQNFTRILFEKKSRSVCLTFFFFFFFPLSLWTGTMRLQNHPLLNISSCFLTLKSYFF